MSLSTSYMHDIVAITVRSRHNAVFGMGTTTIRFSTSSGHHFEFVAHSDMPLRIEGADEVNGYVAPSGDWTAVTYSEKDE